MGWGATRHERTVPLAWSTRRMPQERERLTSQKASVGAHDARHRERRVGGGHAGDTPLAAGVGRGVQPSMAWAAAREGVQFPEGHHQQNEGGLYRWGHTVAQGDPFSCCAKAHIFLSF